LLAEKIYENRVIGSGIMEFYNLLSGKNVVSTS